MSEQITKDGGPAYPGVIGVAGHGNSTPSVTLPNGDIAWVDYAPGMSLRDYFAAKAMSAMVDKIVFDQPTEDALIKTGIKIGEFEAFTARIAYCFADAMLAARGGAK